MTEPGPGRSPSSEPCDLHLTGPTGYLAWMDWADRMSKTHKQRKCRRCGLYAIWVPKTTPARTPSAEATPPLPLHRAAAGWPRCSTCDGGGCPDCTDPA